VKKETSIWLVQPHVLIQHDNKEWKWDPGLSTDYPLSDGLKAVVLQHVDTAMAKGKEQVEYEGQIIHVRSSKPTSAGQPTVNLWREIGVYSPSTYHMESWLGPALPSELKTKIVTKLSKPIPAKSSLAAASPAAPPLGSLTYAVGRRPGGGLGVVAMAVWCALARKIRSSPEDYRAWCIQAETEPMEFPRSHPGGQKRSETPLRAWMSMPNPRAAVQTLLDEHLRYVEAIQESDIPSTQNLLERALTSNHVFPPVVLPKDTVYDTYFLDLYRCLRNNTASLPAFQDAWAAVAVRMLTDTMMNPCFMVVCENRKCSLAWRTDKVDEVKKAGRAPLYRFEGYGNAEHVRTVGNLRPGEEKQFRVLSLVSGGIEYSPHTVVWRNLEHAYLDPHALWSVADATDATQATVCGGLAMYGNHSCKGNVLEFVQPLPTEWFLQARPGVVPKLGEAVTLEYSSKPEELKELFGGLGCECPTCRVRA
jgi:hypothetical protein